MFFGYFVMVYLDFVAATIVGCIFSGILAGCIIIFHKSQLLLSISSQYPSNITQLRLDSERMAYLTSYDMLTGLYNRVWLDRYLNGPAFQEDAKSADYSIVIVDINNLRMLNNNFGLETGNRCLKHLAGLLKELIESDHKLVRYGSDEFVIIMPDATPAQVNQFLARLNQAVVEKSDYPLQISWSSASADEVINSGDSVLTLAEDRLITSKLLDQNSSLSSSLTAILSIMHERNKDTEEHMTRLQNLVIALARKALFPEKQYSELRLLARLHDIGKLVLSDSILMKNGPLNDSEWELVRQHPSIGARIVEMIPNLRQLSPSILSHHERWDGKGYPNHLNGEQIPLSARIISLVDSWDAMTNDRSYRKALSFDQAFQEIRVNSGKQFDPILCTLFLDILKQARFENTENSSALYSQAI
jgi:diguanylate cyclase (GGDEF)-like protein